MQTIFPILRYTDARVAIRWLCATFGFVELFSVPESGPVVRHAQLRLGTNVIMLGSVRSDDGMASPRELGRATQALYVHVDDLDAHFERARSVGAEITSPPRDTDFGAREYHVRDLEGHPWTFGTYRPDVDRGEHVTGTQGTRMPFDLQPTLEGELLRLRPLRSEDFDDLYAVASDPLIWEQHPNSDRHKQDVFKEFFREALESGGALIAIDSEDGRVIGSSRFHGYDSEKSEIEIGWTFLARSHWGGVYNGEMKRLMLRHAFRFVKSVVFLVGPQNVRSQRAMEKIGGVRAGSRLDGKGRESLVYRITAV